MTRFDEISKEKHRELSAKGGRSSGKRRALMAAVEKEARKALLKRVGDNTPIKTICTSLVMTGCRGNVKAVELLLKMAGVDLDNQTIDIDYVDTEQDKKVIRKIYTFLDWQLMSSNLCFVYGTTRSGKTYGILQWIIDKMISGELRGQILVAGQTMPFLRNGACYYLRTICKELEGVEVKDNGRIVTTANATLTCQSFDDPSRALSAQWSAIYLNEGNYIDGEVINQLRIRNAGLVICDYNPSVNRWWGSGLQTESNNLFMSFRDNPYLGAAQLEAIEEIRVRGEKAPAGSYDRWFYEVYYLGQFSEVGGGVFRQVFRQPLTEWEEQTKNLLHVWGIDFGDTTDPNALVEVAVDKDAKTLFVRCLFYETATDDLRLAEILVSNNVDRLIFETATGGNTRALNLRRLGFKGWLAPAEKERVSASVFNLSTWRINCADDTTYSEFSGYRLEEGKFKGADHCIDAVRYAAHLIITNRIKS